MMISLRMQAERDLRRLSLGNQAVIEGLDHGIVLRGSAEARHVDGVANPAAATLDVALAAPLPLSSSYGARPIKAAAISSLTRPSSGIPARRLAEVVSAKPGTLSMIAARSAKSPVALTLAAIAASSFSISAARLFKTRACAFRT